MGWQVPLKTGLLVSRLLIFLPTRSQIATGRRFRFLSHRAMPHSVHSTRESSPMPAEELSAKYWNFNVPRERWTEECPTFLQGLPEKSKRVLSSYDGDYVQTTWDEAKALININRIDLFQRSPTALRRYLKFMHDLKKQHGSVMAFVQQHRLHWASATPSADPPFSNPADYKILYNDWPYGVDPDIVHLVVWTKFNLEDDPATDDLTSKARQEIEEFVVRTFCGEDGIARDQLIWFKNWSSLKSIHALEHFHVMLYKPSSAFVKKITGGDRPISATVTE